RSSSPSGGSSDSRRRDAGNSRFPGSHSNMSDVGCVPERTGLRLGRSLTVGPILARAPDGMPGPGGATTAAGAVGPAGAGDIDAPGRRPGAGARREWVSVAERLPKRNEMQRHDLSQLNSRDKTCGVRVRPAVRNGYEMDE